MFKWLGQQPEKGKRRTRKLWDTEFGVVKDGLDEEQAVAFVDNLIVQHRVSQQASAASLRLLIEKAVADAEQIAANIKMWAQTEAEEETARTINQAKQEADAIKGRAEAAARREAEDIIAVSRKKAELAEVEARQKALLSLIRAREEIEREVRGDYKQAHSRLLSTLQNLVSEGQDIAAELKDKRERLWENQKLELKGAETALLGTAEVAASPAETLVPKEEMQLITPLEEVVAEKAEPSVQQEAPVAKEKPPKPKKKVDKKEKPSVKLNQLKEKVAKKIKPSPGLKKKAGGKATEEPAQQQEKLIAPEVVEAIAAEVTEPQPLAEVSPVQLSPEDSKALYAGEVELAIGIPVELKVVSKFYNYLQTIPDIKILRTTGSWDKGTTITVVADKPIPLVSTISGVPDVEVIPEVIQSDSPEKGTLGSRLRGGGGGGKGVRRIKLTLKETGSL